MGPIENSGIRRVVYEVPNDHVEELIAHMGSFATQHEFTIRLMPEAPRFNPALVATVFEPQSAEPIQIVTHNLLRKFSAEIYGSTSLGERTANSIMSLDRRRRSQEYIRPYLFIPKGETTSAVGIRADRLHALTIVMQDTKHRPVSLGILSLELLGKYCERLVVSDSVDK